jgi:hypothetical protein
MVGRSPYLQPVHVTAGDEIAGEIHPIIIDTIHRYSLFGAAPVRARIETPLVTGA